MKNLLVVTLVTLLLTACTNASNMQNTNTTVISESPAATVINSSLSSEGQNCGRNAGRAGDAQCAEGLECKYETTQNEKDGIGTCVRK